MVPYDRTTGYEHPTTDFTIISCHIPEAEVRKYSICRPFLSSHEVHFLVKNFPRIYYEKHIRKPVLRMIQD